MVQVKQTDEEFVRGVWEKVQRHDQRHMHQSPNEWHGYVIVDTGISEVMIGSGTRKEAWLAAAEFTRDRLEDVQELREEMREVEFISGPFSGERGESWKRILARLNAELARLTAGMKGTQ